MPIVKLLDMPKSQPTKSINRTLLILLGIILAFLLTINAKSFYSAESLSFPRQISLPVDKNVSVGFLEKIDGAAASSFLEKLASLK